MFEPDALHRVVTQALSTTPSVPVGARGAFVTVASQDGVQAAIAVRVATGWEVKAVVTVAPDAEDRWRRPDIDCAVWVTGTF